MEEARGIMRDYGEVLDQMQKDLEQHDSVVDFAERTQGTLIELIPIIVGLRNLSAEIEADDLTRSMEMSVPRPWVGFT